MTLAESRFVTSGYFDAMGIRLMRGRMLSESIDIATNKNGTVVVNQAFVKKFMPSVADPAGQHLDDSDKAEEKTEIAGEVTNIRQSLLDPPMAEMDYLLTEIAPKDFPSFGMTTNLIVRTTGDPKTVIPELRQVFHDIDPTLPFRTPLTMEEIVAEQLIMQRLESWLFGIFAALAVLLAIVGLYGLISHEVEMGARDIGVRMALGATRENVFALVLRRVAILLTIGIGVGLALTFAARKLIATVAEIHFAHQAGLLAVLAATMALAGLLAAAIPMRRAVAVEPMRALRME